MSDKDKFNSIHKYLIRMEAAVEDVGIQEYLDEVSKVYDTMEYIEGVLFVGMLYEKADRLGHRVALVTHPVWCKVAKTFYK